MVKYIYIFCSLLFVVFQFGCSTATPAKRYILNGYKNYKLGEPKTVTIGDEAIVRIYGETWPVYASNRELKLNGLKTVPAGTIWEGYYWYPEKNAIFLISKKLHPQIAVLASFDGTILSKDEAAYQIMGLKTYRRWSLDDNSDNLKYFSKALYIGTGFKLFYLGRKGSTLRFSVAKYVTPKIKKYASSDEKLGEIEYTHNLDDGNLFTIRGIKIQIDNVEPDGTLHYTVISEKETQELLY
jgi:hypothetical protein